MWLLTLTSLLFLSLQGGCSFQSEPDQLFSQTQKDQGSLSDEDKIKNYEYIIKTSEDESVRLKAANGIVDLAFKTNEYLMVDQYLKYVVSFGKSRSNRLESLQKLADNMYYNLKKYKSAIVEYKKLIAIDKNWITNQLMVVKSYFNMGEFNQVHVEIDKLLERKIPKFIKFETLSTKANTFFAGGDFSKASAEFAKLIESFPELSSQNHIALNYSLSLEEEGLVEKAISILSKMKGTYHSPSFIESKIEHLNQKLKKLPGGTRFAR